MFHLSQPISLHEKFQCPDDRCKCRAPGSAKKQPKVAQQDESIDSKWEEVDPNLIEEPLNFSQVDAGLYRSSFPRPSNYKFLSKLRLKTILCLVEDEPLPAQYIDWTDRNGIHLIQIGMPGHKEAFRDGIPYGLVGDALRLVVNRANYPMLIHCNRGKHRTGTVVACLRKLKGWHTTRALDEYARFSHPKERQTDQEFIQSFEVQELRTHVIRNRVIAGVVGSSGSGSGSSEAPPSPFSSILNLAKA